MTHLPSLVLFQKLAPDHVEAIIMAFSACIVNLSEGLMSDLIGVFINKQFIGMTSDDFSDATKESVTPYTTVVYIGFISVVYEIFIIPLIPIKSEI